MLDDLLELRTGDQIPCDGVVRHADGLEIDESLLTGESDPVDKGVGDEVLSGSFVVAGSGRFQATRVGGDSYAREARGRGPAVPAHPLGADGRHQPDPAHRHLGDHPDVGAADLEPAPATATSTTRCGARSPAWSAWCPKGSCCSRASRSGSRRSPWRGARCSCRSCPRSRASRASTSCASTRPARSPRARSCSTSSSRSTTRRRTCTPALGALADDENRNATLDALAAVVHRARRLDPHGRGAVLVGPQVERGELRGHGLVGDGRARDGAHRRDAPGAGAGRRARRRRAPRARARPRRRAARRARRCRRGSSRWRW